MRKTVATEFQSALPCNFDITRDELQKTALENFMKPKKDRLLEIKTINAHTIPTSNPKS